MICGPLIVGVGGVYDPPTRDAHLDRATVACVSCLAHEGRHINKPFGQNVPGALWGRESQRKSSARDARAMRPPTMRRPKRALAPSCQSAYAKTATRKGGAARRPCADASENEGDLVRNASGSRSGSSSRARLQTSGDTRTSSEWISQGATSSPRGGVRKSLGLWAARALIGTSYRVRESVSRGTYLGLWRLSDGRATSSACRARGGRRASTRGGSGRASC